MYGPELINLCNVYGPELINLYNVYGPEEFFDKRIFQYLEEHFHVSYYLFEGVQICNVK